MEKYLEMQIIDKGVIDWIGWEGGGGGGAGGGSPSLISAAVTASK